MYGKLGDQYGRKVVLQVALVVFLIGSALCGLSQSLTELIAFRALQGLGGGGLMVGAQAAVGDVVLAPRARPLPGHLRRRVRTRQRDRPAARWVLHDHLSWRWIFYVNLPIGVAAFAVLAATLPSVEERVHAPDRLPRRRPAGGGAERRSC